MKIWQVDWKKNNIGRMLTMLAKRLRLNKVLLKPKVQNSRRCGSWDRTAREGICHEGKIFSSHYMEKGLMIILRMGIL